MGFVVSCNVGHHTNSIFVGTCRYQTRYNKSGSWRLLTPSRRNTKHSGAPAGDKHSDGGGMAPPHIKAEVWRMNYRAGKARKPGVWQYRGRRPQRDAVRPASCWLRNEQHRQRWISARHSDGSLCLLVAQEFLGDSRSTGYAARSGCAAWKDLFAMARCGNHHRTRAARRDAPGGKEKRAAVEVVTRAKGRPPGKVFLWRADRTR
jgi:hypothetical protein